MNIRYRVELHQSERDELRALLAGGQQPVRRLKRAQILLAADRGASDGEIAERVVCGMSTVTRTKRRFVEGNLELARIRLAGSPGIRAFRARPCAGACARTSSSHGAGTCGAFPRLMRPSLPPRRTFSTSTITMTLPIQAVP